jgi:integrase
MQDVVLLKWKHVDIDAGTYSFRRRKTSLPQVGTLWPETIAELKKIPQRSEYILLSGHGAPYNRNSRGNDFAEYRDALGLHHVQWDMLRDGAYTAACKAPHVEERFARVMAGHKSPGLEDRYVLRSPQIAREACEAVHKYYFG